MKAVSKKVYGVVVFMLENVSSYEQN